MRVIALAGCCLALAFSACGNAESEATTKKPPRPRAPTVKMSKAEIAKLPPLTIPRPIPPLQHRLQVIDIRKGSGPGVPKHDWVTNREEVYMRLLEASYAGARVGQVFGRIPISRSSSKAGARG